MFFRANQLIHLIDTAPDTGLPKFQLYQTLGLSVSMTPPPDEDKKAILVSVCRLDIAVYHVFENITISQKNLIDRYC